MTVDMYKQMSNGRSVYWSSCDGSPKVPMVLGDVKDLLATLSPKELNAVCPDETREQADHHNQGLRILMAILMMSFTRYGEVNIVVSRTPTLQELHDLAEMVVCNLNALRSKAIDDAGKTEEDDPSNDATDAAHPAWWRGCDHGVKNACESIQQYMSGARAGKPSFGSAELNEVVGKILGLMGAIQTLGRSIVSARAGIDFTISPDLGLHVSSYHWGELVQLARDLDQHKKLAEQYFAWRPVMQEIRKYHETTSQLELSKLHELLKVYESIPEKHRP